MSPRAGGAVKPTQLHPRKNLSSLAVEIDRRLPKRRDMSCHDYLIALLHLGSSLEHALMVQYLYSAYSLGGDQVPEEYRPMIQRWRETILAVAREEMGHLLTVQNVLTFLGAGLSLTRENFPWEIEWFNLEPFTLGALACYVYAEMPENEAFPDKVLIENLAREHLAKNGGNPKEIKLHPVGEVYDDIMKLLKDPELIPDTAFQEETYVLQASWDDWGRGYKPDPRPLDPEGNLEKISTKAEKAEQFRSHVMIERVATRTEALAALKALSIQGEGPLAPTKGEEWSHFKRFMAIFTEYQEEMKGQKWSPTFPVPTNPHTEENSCGLHPDNCCITSIKSRNWAILFNLRYRMLLTFLMHTFQVARVSRPGEPNIRGMLMHKVFGEMYNLKTIAGILVQLPLRDDGSPMHAGPPFEPPYNLRLPPADVDCWCLHLDILGTASGICKKILESDPRHEDRAYIETLIDIDAQTKDWINQILAGMNTTERY